MTMDVKGITWVGNIYQKFENLCLEVEDTMFEDTVKYIENQMQTVGESVKKIYSDVMQDLLPPSPDLDETSASEFPKDQYIDAGFSKKSFQGSKKITVMADASQTTEKSRTDCDVDVSVIHAKAYNSDAVLISPSCNCIKAGQYVESSFIKLNLGSDESQQSTNTDVSKTVSEITLSKADTCCASQSRELSNVNQYHAAIVLMPASPEVTTRAFVTSCCNGIENVSEIPGVLVINPEEEKEINTSSYSSGVPFGDSNESTETWDFDVPEIDSAVEEGYKTMQQEDELKLEETCVMVTRDELQLVPKAEVDLKTSKNKRRQPFSLSKKSARKQEYEDLALLHENNEKRKGECLENPCQTDQQKLLVPDISELEWELL